MNTRSMIKVFLFGFSLLIALPFQANWAHGQTSLDLRGGATHPGGSFVPGYDSASCDSSIEGAIRYNSTLNCPEACDGLIWSCSGTTNPSGCTSPGETCDDGSIFVGLSPDGYVPMYTTPADATGLYSYNNGVGVYSNLAMDNCTDATPGTAESCRTGAANTTYLLEATNETGYPFEAAEYCAGLTAHGHNDWYLPAQDELDVLYRNKSAGDLAGTFDEGGTKPNGYYWASSEFGIVYARSQRFSDGKQDDNYTSKNDEHALRCVRK